MATDPAVESPSLDPHDLRAVLMPVSLVLLAVGLLDGATILYSAWTGKAYTSNFYVFALIGAIFLGRGNLFAASVATVAAAFFISALVGMAAIIPVYMPQALIHCYLQQAPGPIIGSMVRSGLMIVLLIWILRRLRHPVVLRALAESGAKPADAWKKPAVGFMLGFLVPLVNALSFASMQGSSVGRMAVTEAQKQANVGEHLYLLNVGPATSSDARGQAAADLLVYTDTTLRPLHIVWKPTFIHSATRH